MPNNDNNLLTAVGNPQAIPAPQVANPKFQAVFQNTLASMLASNTPPPPPDTTQPRPQGTKTFATTKAAHETAQAANADNQYQNLPDNLQQQHKDVVASPTDASVKSSGYNLVATTPLNQGQASNTQAAVSSMKQVQDKNGGQVPESLVHVHNGDSIDTYQMMDPKPALANVNLMRRAQGLPAITGDEWDAIPRTVQAKMAKDAVTFHAPADQDGRVTPASIQELTSRLGVLKGQPQFEGKDAMVDTMQKSLDYQKAVVAHAHDSLLKKIGRVAEIAGTAIAPGVMAAIPGTQANQMAVEQGQEIRQGRQQALEAQQAQTNFVKSQTLKNLAGLGGGGGSVEEQTYADLMTGGNSGAPRINPDTNKPYTRLEALEAIKNVKEAPSKAPKVNFSQGGEPLSITVGDRDYIAGDPDMPLEVKPIMAQAQKNFTEAIIRKNKPLTKQEADQLNRVYDPVLREVGLPSGQFSEGMTSTEVNTSRQSLNSSISATHADRAQRSKGFNDMLKTGEDSFSHARLTLDNAPDSMFVDTNGNPIPYDNLNVQKPSQQERNRSRFAASALHILDELDRLKIQGKLQNGPLQGVVQQILAQGGFGGKAQEAIDLLSFGSTAQTGAHVAGRFSVDVLNKMGKLLKMNMNDTQFAAGERAIREVMVPYTKVYPGGGTGFLTVRDYKDMRKRGIDPAATGGEAEPSPNAPPINLLKEGVHTTFKNGQTWTLTNGQPVQVQ